MPLAEIKQAQLHVEVSQPPKLASQHLAWIKSGAFHHRRWASFRTPAALAKCSRTTCVLVAPTEAMLRPPSVAHAANLFSHSSAFLNLTLMDSSRNS